MKLLLKWKTREPQADSTLLYRSLTPFGPDVSLLTPIATLPGGATTYVDEDVVVGFTYYYRTLVIKGALSAVSAQFSALAVMRNGPGPRQLEDGDYESGLFGYADTPEMPLGRDVNTQLDLNLFSDMYTNGWVKFAYQGKILYVQNNYRTQTWYNWLTMYHAGLVYGTDDDGIYIPTMATPTNQKRTITHNDDTFIVRLMRGAADPLNPFNYLTQSINGVSEYAYDNSSEFDSTLGRLNSKVSRSTLPKFNSTVNCAAVNSNGSYARYFAEAFDDKYLIRGKCGTNQTDFYSDSFYSAINVNYDSSVSFLGTTNTYVRPLVILEWVPSYAT